ncbi:AzlD domain-containing protein [Bounagaea algeriensis]
MTLPVVLALACGTYLLRLAGPLLRERMRLSQRWERGMSIGAITLLGAFVVTSAAFDAGEFAGVERVAGVVVGGVLAWRRAPFALVVLAAAATTALLRLALPR